MFHHTLGLIDKTKADIKRAVFIVQLCLYSFIVAVPLFRMIIKEDYILNLPLFLISFACLILFIIENAKKDIRYKKLLKLARKFRNKLNVAILTLTLIVSLSGVLFIGTSVLLMVIFVLSLIGWITVLLFKIAAKFIEVRLEMFGEAICMDFAPVTSPVITAANSMMEKLGKEPIQPVALEHEKEIRHLADVHKAKCDQAKEEKRVERKKRFSEFKEKIKITK